MSYLSPIYERALRVMFPDYVVDNLYHCHEQTFEYKVPQETYGKVSTKNLAGYNYSLLHIDTRDCVIMLFDGPEDSYETVATLYYEIQFIPISTARYKQLTETPK